MARRLWLDLGEFGHLTGCGVPIQAWHDHGLGLLRTIMHADGLMTDIASLRLCRSYDDLPALLDGYDMLLMNVRSYTFPHAVEAARTFKRLNPKGTVLVGGMHATVDIDAMSAVEEFDRICQGGGEKAICDLVRDWQSFDRVFKPPQAKSLAEWPMIDRKLWPRESQSTPYGQTWPLEPSCGWGDPPVATMITSRVCPFRCNFSVTGDALIPVEGLGLVTMANLRRYSVAAQAVASGDGSVVARPMSIRVATDIGMSSTSYWVDEGVRPVNRLTLQNGLSIKATTNHRLRVIRSGAYAWSELKDIKVADWLPVQHSTEAWGDYQKPGGITLDESLGWLIGYFIGNGAFHGRSAVDWCVRPEYEARVLDTVERIFGKRLNARTPKQSDKVRIIQLSGQSSCRFFSDDLGLGDNKLKVPEAILCGPKAVAESFIEGLFQADGYTPKDGSTPYITTISEELANGLALLLINLGKHAAVVKVKKSPRSMMRSTHYYRVALDQRDDRIPIGKSAYVNKYHGGRYVGWRSGLKALGSTGVMRDLALEIEPHHDLLARKQWYSQVVSNEPAGSEAVYDITVPDGESFVANGFIAHNCNEFAYIPNMDRKPVEMVIDELNFLDRTYGVGSVVLHDSMFFQHPTYLKEWLEKYPRLARKRWPYWAAGRADTVRMWPDLFEALVKETNWTTVSIGFESGSDRMLKMINKECTVEDNYFTIDLLNRIGDDLEREGKERPRFWANVMFGIPGETPEDVFATHRMVRMMNNPMVTPATYAPFPGSMLGYQITAEGKSLLGEQHFRFLGGKYMTGIDYDFLGEVAEGAHEFDISEKAWLDGIEPPKPLHAAQHPSHFWLFPLKNGKRRLAHGQTVEQAREILSWRMTPEEMGQIADAPPIEMRQQDIHAHLKELG